MISPLFSPPGAAAPPDHGSPAASPSPPYAFATHLLGALGPVKRKHQSALREVEALATMIRSRAAAEEDYAKQLERMVSVFNGGGGGLASSLLRLKAVGVKSPFALRGSGGGSGEDAPLDRSQQEGQQQQQQDVEGEFSTFDESLSCVQADLLKKAGQRKQLAQCLRAEVHEPMEALKQHLAAEGQELEEEEGLVAKELKALRKKYEAALAAATAADTSGTTAGAPTPTPTSSSSRSSRRSKGFPASPFADLSASSPAARRLASLSSGFLQQVSRADPASWLLPSGSGSGSSSGSGSNTAAAATGGGDGDRDAASQEQLEEASRERYAELVEGTLMAGRRLQVVLTRYQLLMEACTDEVGKLLRQAIVFESSCLSNEVYEANTTFRVIESVDKDKDLEAFIAVQLRNAPPPSPPQVHPDGQQQQHDALLQSLSRSLGLLSLPPPPPPPPLVATATTPPQATTPPPALLLGPADLPNLSAPAPNVVPARYVLRLLSRGSAASPPPTPIPTPTVTALPVVLPPNPLPPPQPIAAPPTPAVRSPTRAPPLASAPQQQQQLPTSPIPVVRRSPMSPPMHAVSDQDDEEEDEENDEEEEEEEGFEGTAAAPAPSLAHRSLKELVQKRHEKQRASGAVSPLVDLEEFTTEQGGLEYAL